MQAREEAIANTGSVGMADAHEDDIILFSDIDEALLGRLFYGQCTMCTASAVRSGCAQRSECSFDSCQVFSREFLSLAVNCRILSTPKPIVTNHTAFLEWSQSAEVRPRPACAEP
jgi:hypothetical protein